MSQFDTWLRQLAAAQEGPVTLNIDRGLPFIFNFTLPGDWHTGTLTGSLRANPDASGSTLVDFTVATPTYNAGSGLTTFGISLTKVQTAALPGDDDLDGLAEVVFDLLFSHTDLPIQQRLFAGNALISGKVTNAA